MHPTRHRRSNQIPQAVNVAIDGGVGIIPVLGDLFDTLFKSNLRNLALFEVRTTALPPLFHAFRWNFKSSVSQTWLLQGGHKYNIQVTPSDQFLPHKRAAEAADPVVSVDSLVSAAVEIRIQAADGQMRVSLLPPSYLAGANGVALGIQIKRALPRLLAQHIHKAHTASIARTWIRLIWDLTDSDPVMLASCYRVQACNPASTYTI